jgi:hypothetical protein
MRYNVNCKRLAGIVLMNPWMEELYILMSLFQPIMAGAK